MASLCITLIRYAPMFLVKLNAQSCLADMSFLEAEGDNEIEICHHVQRLFSS
jgi:hypothetical protein